MKVTFKPDDLLVYKRPNSDERIRVKFRKYIGVTRQYAAVEKLNQSSSSVDVIICAVSDLKP